MVEKEKGIFDYKLEEEPFLLLFWIQQWTCRILSWFWYWEKVLGGKTAGFLWIFESNLMPALQSESINSTFSSFTNKKKRRKKKDRIFAQCRKKEAPFVLALYSREMSSTYPQHAFVFHKTLVAKSFCSGVNLFWLPQSCHEIGIQLQKVKAINLTSKWRKLFELDPWFQFFLNTIVLKSSKTPIFALVSVQYFERNFWETNLFANCSETKADFSFLFPYHFSLLTTFCLFRLMIWYFHSYCPFLYKINHTKRANWDKIAIFIDHVQKQLLWENHHFNPRFHSKSYQKVLK